MTARSIAGWFRRPLPGPALPRIPQTAVRVALPLGVLALAWRLGQQPRASLALLVFAPLLVAVMFRARPLVVPGLVFAISAVPLSIGTGTQSSLNLAILGVAGLFAFEVARRLASKRPPLPRSPSNVAWLAFLAVAALSVLAGGTLWDPRVPVQADFVVVQLAQLAIFALSAAAFWLPGLWMPTRRELVWLAGAVVGLAAIVAAQLVVPALPFALIGEVWANPVARVWLVAVPGSFALFHGGLRPLPRLALLFLGASLVLLPWRADAGWASGWLPAFVTLIALVALRLGRISVVLGVAALAPAVVAFASILLPRLAADDHWSLATRLNAWRGLIELLDGRWTLGLGLASYWHYWRGIIGSFAYFDPAEGYMHVTLDPKVNMHNNYLDVLAQMGLLGMVVLAALLGALAWHAARTYRAETEGFGHAYAAASIAALTGMLSSGMLGDWFFPFVYNIGLLGFRGSSLGWLLLGGLCVLDATREGAAAPGTDMPPDAVETVTLAEPDDGHPPPRLDVGPSFSEPPTPAA